MGGVHPPPPPHRPPPRGFWGGGGGYFLKFWGWGGGGGARRRQGADLAVVHAFAVQNGGPVFGDTGGAGGGVFGLGEMQQVAASASGGERVEGQRQITSEE